MQRGAAEWKAISTGSPAAPRKARGCGSWKSPPPNGANTKRGAGDIGRGAKGETSGAGTFEAASAQRSRRQSVRDIEYFTAPTYPNPRSCLLQISRTGLAARRKFFWSAQDLSCRRECRRQSWRGEIDRAGVYPEIRASCHRRRYRSLRFGCLGLFCCFDAKLGWAFAGNWCRVRQRDTCYGRWSARRCRGVQANHDVTNRDPHSGYADLESADHRAPWRTARDPEAGEKARGAAAGIAAWPAAGFG